VTASVAAAVIATGPVLFAPGTHESRRAGTTDLALAGRYHAAPRAEQPRHAGQAADPEKPVNPALAARQAMTVRYTAAVQAARPAAASGTPQQIAIQMLAGFGWSSSEFSCLNSLWERESGWNPYAANPSSGAYGIPQALPGSKMATAGADWQTNAATQITWGLGYIQSTYGSPCSAWGHETSTGWY
jgi:hypothetical protein